MNCYGLIYKSTNKVNGKIYIGQTTRTLKCRMKEHISDQRKYHFHNALRKYGKKNFGWKILEYCDSKEEMDEMEFHYIKQYNSFDDGYNFTYGGEGSVGYKHSKETLKKLSLSLKGKMTGENNPFYGKKHTEKTKKLISEALLNTDKHPNRGKKLPKEWRDKISESNIGRSLSLESRAKISKTKKGKFIGKDNKCAKKFVITTPDNDDFYIIGIADFSRKYENGLLDFRLLSAVAVGKRNHHKGYKCRYYNENIDSNLPLWEQN